MKTVTQKLPIIIFGCMCINSFSQQAINPTDDYFAGMKVNKDGNKNLFNDAMVNILFANKVGAVFGGSNDLSITKFYASLDADDNSLAIGANFENRGDDITKKLTWVLSAGVKVNANNKFATVYNDGDFLEDNIGATLKLTLIGNGIINYESKGDYRKSAVRAYQQVLDAKYDTISNELSKSPSLAFEDVNKKKQELYIQMAKEEIAYIEKNEFYRYLWDHWHSLEVYAPFGENSYKTTPDIATALDTRKFYAFNATYTGNTMWMFSSGLSIFIKGQVSWKNNNTILVNNVSTKPFQTTAMGANGVTIITDSTDGYITEYDQFFTTSALIEPAIFFFNNSIGFSPALEFNLGTYDKTNWKLGIPVSFKDKEGKPTVNFEIQWKELNTLTSSVHVVGVSANFQFGKLID